MAKRQTATEKWADPWFCSLSERDRLFWIYLLDNCNHAGIWQINWMVVEIYFPGIDHDLGRFGDRVIVIDAEKVFIPKFVTFQYGELNPSNRVHLSVLGILKKEGLWKTLGSPYLGSKDKDKIKVKDKDKGSAPGARASTYMAEEEDDDPDAILMHEIRQGKRICLSCHGEYLPSETDDTHSCDGAERRAEAERRRAVIK
jgi:hypothetical protein